MFLSYRNRKSRLITAKNPLLNRGFLFQETKLIKYILLIPFLIYCAPVLALGPKPVYFKLSTPYKSETSNTPETLSYQTVDLYAKNAPEFEKISDLVNYLIRPYQHDEKLKVRVIFAWIAYHIEYDSFKATIITGNNQKKHSYKLNSGNPYKTRVGICGDIADLFLKMCRLAHLNAERIDGSAGYNLTLENASKSLHAWNAVEINNKWHLLDVTWAMNGNYIAFTDITRIKDYKKEIRSRKKNPEKVKIMRSINNTWFLTPPEVMILTHFPNKIKWQLLENPISPRKIWKQNTQKKKEQEKEFNIKKNKTAAFIPTVYIGDPNEIWIFPQVDPFRIV